MPTVPFGRERTLLQELEQDIRLSLVGGVAYLDGRVSCYERKRALTHLVQGLPSVERVVNRLRVAPGCLRSDRTIEEEVRAVLRIDPALQLERVLVKAIDGVVELTGVAPDLATRMAAETAAWSACGVHHVENRLRLSQRQDHPLSSLGRSA